MSFVHYLFKCGFIQKRLRTGAGSALKVPCPLIFSEYVCHNVVSIF
jgi:hypothetical protein